MRERIAYRSERGGYSRSRLPQFTADEVEYIRGTLDFIGTNYYTTVLVADAEEAPFELTGYIHDAKVTILRDPKWKGSAADWLKVNILNPSNPTSDNFPTDSFQYFLS